MKEFNLRKKSIEMIERYFPEVDLKTQKISSMLPDLFIGFKNGNKIFIEIKTNKGNLTRFQERTILEIRKRKIQVYIARSIEDVKEIIRKGG